MYEAALFSKSLESLIFGCYDPDIIPVDIMKTHCVDSIKKFCFSDSRKVLSMVTV